MAQRVLTPGGDMEAAVAHALVSAIEDVGPEYHSIVILILIYNI